MNMMKSLKKWLQSLATSSPGSEYRVFWVKCDNCGAIFKVGYRPGTDVNWGEGDRPGVVGTLHKEAMDSSCFRPIIISIGLNARKHEIYRDVSGGTFVEEPSES